MLVVTDADNTLWDTDGVFAAAQLRLLARIEAALGRQSDTSDRLAFVRAIDQRIAASRGGDLRYPPMLLVRGLCDELSRGSVCDTSNRINCSSEEAVFLRDLSENVPALRPGVRDGLVRLCRMRATVVVATESDRIRCQRILQGHQLSSMVDHVVAGRKSSDFFRAIRSDYGQPSQPAYIVGDQIDRDIEFGRSAGFVTVLFPGGFRPVWTLTNGTKPDLVVSDFDEAARFIEHESGAGVSMASG